MHSTWGAYSDGDIQQCWPRERCDGVKVERRERVRSNRGRTKKSRSAIAPPRGVETGSYRVIEGTMGGDGPKPKEEICNFSLSNVSNSRSLIVRLRRGQHVVRSFV